MKPKVLATIVVIVAAATLIAAVAMGSSATPSTGPEGARTVALSYLDEHHDLPFPIPGAGGWEAQDLTDMLGFSRILYTQDGWSVEVSYPVVLEPTYNVIIEYVQPREGIPYHLRWDGTVTGGIAIETDYWLAQ